MTKIDEEGDPVGHDRHDVLVRPSRPILYLWRTRRDRSFEDYQHVEGVLETQNVEILRDQNLDITEEENGDLNFYESWPTKLRINFTDYFYRYLDFWDTTLNLGVVNIYILENRKEIWLCGSRLEGENGLMGKPLSWISFVC